MSVQQQTSRSQAIRERLRESVARGSCLKLTAALARCGQLDRGHEDPRDHESGVCLSREHTSLLLAKAGTSFGPTRDACLGRAAKAWIDSWLAPPFYLEQKSAPAYVKRHCLYPACATRREPISPAGRWGAVSHLRSSAPDPPVPNAQESKRP